MNEDGSVCLNTIVHTLLLVSSIESHAPTCWLYDVAEDEEACVDQIPWAIYNSPDWSSEHLLGRRYPLDNTSFIGFYKIEHSTTPGTCQ